MDFGVVLQTNPPASRTVELARQAETYGFSHVWTFDSHLLWQEPFVIYSAILAATRKVMVGPMVTNPATRDWTVIASLFATLNEMYGNRTICGIGRGDSAVRTLHGRPSNLATLRESVHVIRELANSRAVEVNGAKVQFPWSTGSALDVWVAAYGPLALKLTGEVGDGFILQLADPDIAAWTIKVVRDAAEQAGRDPDAIQFCVAAPDVRRRRDRPGAHARAVPLVRRDGRQPRRRHRRAATAPTRRSRKALTDYIAGRAGLRLQRARPRREHARRLRARRDRRAVLPPGQRGRARREARGPARPRRHPVRRLPPARQQGGDAAAVRRARHPGRWRRRSSRPDDRPRDEHERAGRYAGGASACALGPRATVAVGCSRSLLLAALWELVKLVVPDTGGHVLGASVLPRTDDVAMPHVWTIGQRMLEPETSAAGSPIVLNAMLQACWFTLRVALAGWVLGVGRRLPARRADAAVAGRRVGAAAVGGAQPDGPAHRARAARGRLGRQDPHRRVRVAAVDVGRAHRVLPGVLPGRGRRAARAAVAARGAGRAVPGARGRVEPHDARACGCPRASRTCCPRCGSAPPPRWSARSSPRSPPGPRAASAA